MADQIEGLPEGVTVHPLQSQEETASPQSVGDKSGIEGLPEGATVRALPPTSPEKSMGGAGGSWEPQSTSSKVWEKVTTPLLSQPLMEKRATEYATAAPTMTEAEHPYRTAAKKFGAGVVGSTEKMARDFSSPLGIAAMEAGPILEGAAESIPALKGLAESSPYIKPALKYGQRAIGGLFGAQGAVEAGKGVKQAYEEGGFTPETAEQTLGGAGIAAMGGAGALEGTKIGQERAGKVMAAPVRGAAKAATTVQPVIPTLTGSVLGGLAGEAAGHPMLGMMAGGAVGRKLIPKDLGESFLEKGRTLGLNDEEANIAHLQERYNKALKDAKAPADEYAAHEPGRQRGIPAPEDVMKAHEKAQTALQAAKAHLDAAKEDYEAKKGAAPVAPEQPIELSPEQKLAQDTRQALSPTDVDIQARQEKLMGAMEAKVGIEKPKAEPEVPAAPKPKAPPIMTAGAPERAPSMRVLKVDEHGKVIDTTAAESAAREALGVESPARQVPATEGIATPAGGAPRMRTPFAKEEPAPAPQIPVRREAPVAEAPKVEAPKADVPKEAPERSPEDLSKVDTVVKELPNQDLIRHGSRFGIDETKYDFSKRVALREGGSKHPVEREAHANATLAALPEDLKNHIVDAANAWDAKNPKIFDPASYTNASRAERARAIMNEATKRYQDGLAAKAARKTVNQSKMNPEQRAVARERLAKEGQAGGAPDEEKVGTEEGAKQDTAFFAQAKKELPEGNLSDWAKRAQELKDKGAEKADEVEFNPEKFRTQTLETPKEFKEKPEEPKGTKGHSYEYSKDGDTHQVTVRNKGGNSVASITAKETEGNPNVWQMKFSASDEKGEGLKGYKRLAEAAKAQAERENEPITLRGDDEMSAAARRTWVKMGDDYEVVWDKEHHPSITFKPTSEATPENASGAYALEIIPRTK